MIIAIIVLSILFIGSIALNFLLLKVLKNTFDNIDSMMQIDNIKKEVAYDDKYYKGDLILTTQFNQKQDSMITDFSLYDEKKIIGITVNTKEDIPYRKMWEEAGMSAEDLEKPVLLKNCIVYQPIKGLWKWKYQ